MFEKLNYYVMIGRIADQILDIKEKSRLGKKVRTYGVPNSFSPEDLLRFQFERIHILEVAIKCSETDIEEWIKSIDRRSPLDEKEKFINKAERELLELAIT